MSKRAWVLGDLHLSGETEWQSAVSNKVIDWVHEHEYNNPSTEVILAGDLIDKFHSGPRSHYLVMKFLAGLKTSKVHIVVGNHDIEKDESETGQILSYEYASLFSHSNVEYALYSYPTEFTAAGLSCIAIPFYKAPVHSLVELKEKNPLAKYGIDADKEFDLCIGHHFVEDKKQGHIPEEIKIDFKKLVPNAKKLLAGHVHVADSLPNTYLGSLYAKKIDEQGQRYHWVYHSDMQEWHRHKVPVFCELVSVKYGEQLPPVKHKNALPVYTITQCPNPEKARSYYGPDVYIRKVVSSWEHIRTNQDFAEIDPSLYQNTQEGMISKKELMSKFEQMVLDDAAEWKKVDVSKDVLTSAVQFIRDLSKEGTEHDSIQ